MGIPVNYLLFLRSEVTSLADHNMKLCGGKEVAVLCFPNLLATYILY